MEDQNVGEPKVEAASEAKEPEPKADTQNEDRVKALEEELARVTQNYKSVQGVLKKKDEEIKTSSSLRADIEGLKETQKILAAMLQDRGTVPEENLDNIPKEKKQDYLKQFEEVQKKVELKRQQEEAIAKLQDAALSLKARTEALGLKETDEAYIEIQELVETGRLRTAEARVKKLESEKEKKVVKEPEIKKETDEQIFERIAREKGLLKTETVVPAGKGGTETEILKQYNSGGLTSAQANEKLRAIGARPIV